MSELCAMAEGDFVGLPEEVFELAYACICYEYIQATECRDCLVDDALSGLLLTDVACDSDKASIAGAFCLEAFERVVRFFVIEVVHGHGCSFS